MYVVTLCLLMIVCLNPTFMDIVILVSITTVSLLNCGNFLQEVVEEVPFFVILQFTTFLASLTFLFLQRSYFRICAFKSYYQRLWRNTKRIQQAFGRLWFGSSSQTASQLKKLKVVSKSKSHTIKGLKWLGSRDFELKNFLVLGYDQPCLNRFCH